jgi:ADP-heptose:LPS heptosyltransferase
MHLITPARPLPNHEHLPIGVPYLVDTQLATQLTDAGYLQKSEPFTDPRANLPVSSLPVSGAAVSKSPSLLVLRAGGYGDLLFLTPSLAELHRRYPKLQITVATHQHTREVLHHPDLAHVQVIDYPVPASDLARYDIISSAERITDPEMQHDAAAYFAHHLGLIDLPVSQSPSLKVSGEAVFPSFPLTPLYAVDPEDLAQAWLAFPRHEGRARIGIQAESSVKNRTYPVDYTAELIKTLIQEDGADVFTFGYPAPKQVQIPHFYPLQCMDPAPSLTQSAAVLATMDAVIAPDSALCHIAGALGIPTIALYGPFHWRQRTSHMPSVHALQGHAECAPCQWHLTKGQHYPPHMPCSRLVGPAGQQRQAGCKALANIPSERIRKELWKHLQASINQVNEV